MAYLQSIIDLLRHTYSGWELPLALAIIVAAGIVRGFTGFGAGLVGVPLMALMWGPVEAMATSVVLGIAATLQLVPRAIPITNWKDSGPMIAASTLATPAGTLLLVSLDPEIVKKIISALVLIVTLITLRGWVYRGPRGPMASGTAGLVGGVINGLAGVGGPALVLYLISLPERAEVHRANIVMALAVTSTVSAIGLYLAGAVTTRVITNTAILLVPSIVSVWIGAKLFTVLPARIFRLVILWFLVAISVAILLA